MDKRENPATCVDTLAPSHKALAARDAGAVADDAEHQFTHHLPVPIETLGAIGREVRSFFKEISHRIVATTNEPQTIQFL